MKCEDERKAEEQSVNLRYSLVLNATHPISKRPEYAKPNVNTSSEMPSYLSTQGIIPPERISLEA